MFTPSSAAGACDAGLLSTATSAPMVRRAAQLQPPADAVALVDLDEPGLDRHQPLTNRSRCPRASTLGMLFRVRQV